MKPLFAFLLLCLVALVGRPAEADALQRDLGQGLAYVRVHALPADLPAAKSGALVLDLRYTRASNAGVTALSGWLQFRTSPHTPVLVLVNSATARAILDFLENAGAVPGLVTLGGATSRYVPDVALKVPAAAERTAYEALENGALVESLLNDTPDKPRHDEAALAQEPVPAAAGDEDADTTNPAADAATPKTTPPPLIDVALQRAVQLHRALVALRRVK